ncbi:hypothetical protein TWF730_007723 [Orbilia blumenaviensis]|uniref:Uncharacterized protein n=1 Tax=Orbilia blumenaviensis TaxID=1796055 RepID=A0AAV9VBW7_9PEZI
MLIHPEALDRELAQILTASACRKRRRPGHIGKNDYMTEQLEHMASENEILAKNPDVVTEAALFRKWIECCLFPEIMVGQRYGHLVRGHG